MNYFSINTFSVRRISLYLLIIVVAAIANQCANSITKPTGGPKDVTPPTVLETYPENGSAKFTGDKFSVKFDEFISLENIQQAALISPPMEELPDFRIKGKTLQVKFNEELKPNTTYSVYFGDAITDITENNPVSNYTYIFSTGDYVDSLSLYGTVTEAFTHLPVDGAFVMLYKDNNDTIVFDSLPYYVVPYYLSKTNAQGRFQFSGLSDEEYLIFSLLDQNSNIIFDQPAEQIAFLDTLITPGYIDVPEKDTIHADSLIEIKIEADSIIVTDTAIVDSTLIKQILQNSVDLSMFLSPDTVQRLEKAELVTKNEVRFAFTQPALNVKFEMLNFFFDDSLMLERFSENKDTITWYLNEPPVDSLELLLTQFSDTLGTVYLKLDPNKQSTRVRKKDIEKKEYLGWKSNINGGIIKPDEKLTVEFSQPMVEFNNLDSTLLVMGVDSIWNPEFFFTDSLYNRIEIPIDNQEDTKYRVFFPDSSFTSWNNINTQMIDINFRTLPLSDYGEFVFHLQPEFNQDYILQLMDDKENIISNTLFHKDTIITYKDMNPAMYKFRVIYDLNGNGKWDPGNYGIKLQPEPVIFYQKEVKVRANWEIEEDWKF